MVKLLKLGKSEEEIKDLENREGKLNKKTIKRYLFLDAHKTASSDDIRPFAKVSWRFTIPKWNTKTSSKEATGNSNGSQV